MSRRAACCALLTSLLCVLVVPASRAQTVELSGGQTVEGGAGRSIGGNIPAAPGEEEKPAVNPWYLSLIHI